MVVWDFVHPQYCQEVPVFLKMLERSVVKNPYLGRKNEKNQKLSCAFRDEHEQRVGNKVRATQPPTRKAIPYPIPSMGLVYLAT